MRNNAITYIVFHKSAVREFLVRMTLESNISDAHYVVRQEIFPIRDSGLWVKFHCRNGNDPAGFETQIILLGNWPVKLSELTLFPS